MRLSLLLALALILAACDSADDEPVVAEADSVVTVDYVGQLEDGTVFDQGRGVTFALGQVIPGFRDGIVGMRVGERKTIVVPPEEGYGERGVPGRIPPNATLTFNVTLRAVR